MVVLLSHTIGNKTVYTPLYKAEIGAENSRFCGNCACIIKDACMYYAFYYKTPERCTCVVCCKQPPSLKSAASEIVFSLYNKYKFRFDDTTT